MATIREALCQTIERKNPRSCWDKGVRLYALELLDNLAGLTDEELCSKSQVKRFLLNGASDWKHYSESGCALCYDVDIAHRLCNPTELKQTREGRRSPNSRETWLDVQTRALHQACDLILRNLPRREVQV